MIELDPLISSRTVVRDAFGRFLIVERPDKGEQAGMLQFPGGGVQPEDGDPFEMTLSQRLRKAAERETVEETGLIVKTFGGVIRLDPYIITDGNHAGQLCTPYMVEADVVGGEMGSGSEQLATSWWAGTIILRSNRFTDATREGAALVLGGVPIPSYAIAA